MENISKALRDRISKLPINNAPNYAEVMKQVYADQDVKQFLTDHQSELTAENINRGEAKLYEFFNEKNKIANHETSFAPGYKPVLTLSKNLIDVTYEPTEDLLEKRQEQNMSKLVTSVGMPKMIESARLSEFDMNENGRNSAYGAALEFIDRYNEQLKADSHQFVPGLYLTGSFGVGKTYLLGSIANQLAKSGVSTQLVHFPSFAVELREAIKSNQTGAKIDVVKQSAILMLDDIGADSLSEWIRDDVLGVILEYRMQNELPTFFSSNFTMQEFEEQHLPITKNGVEDSLKAKRIMERIRFLSRETPMSGLNRRNKG